MSLPVEHLTTTVAVRALCNFTAKRGDLDRRFTPAPSADEGRTGHLIAASRRGPEYRSEVSLHGQHLQLTVRGRADGYDALERRIDEFKTHRGDLDRMPNNHRALHWAQLKVYGWLLCQREQLSATTLALVYFDVDSQEETILHEAVSAAELQRFFIACCEAFQQWAQTQDEYRQARNAALLRLVFPFDSIRAGQRDLLDAVGAAADAGQHLLAEAPTGIGKTLGTLFPMLQALATGKVDKIFYLTAKSTGRRLALDTLQQLTKATNGAHLRTLELVAREKLCVHPDKECHGGSCPLAKGFYDRLPAARISAVAAGQLTEARIGNIAAAHGICPYYLSQEMAQWSDVIVGDYNHYFDRSGMLYRMTIEHEWRVALLVDEAHNLLGRARSMYSGAVSESMVADAMYAAPLSLCSSLSKLQNEWHRLRDVEASAYLVGDEIPVHWLSALKEVISLLTEYSAAATMPLDGALRELLFAGLQFCRLADEFGEDSIFAVATTPADGKQTLLLDNVIPARFLRPRFDAVHCCILFSATLTPAQFHRDLLGLPASCRHLEVASPFIKDQLAVTLVSDVPTNFRSRRSSVTPIARLIAETYTDRPGNYLAFLSSFDYLDLVFGEFAVNYPHIPCWQQTRRMSERERRRFIDRFEADSRGVGFAVLGGAFAEGIDLPGNRLIGAFIATLGLPQVNAVNQAVMHRMQERYGAGFEYTYLYPGVQKVVQAAGRIIRTTADQGSLHLIDSRYQDERVRELLPSWWEISSTAW